MKLLHSKPVLLLSGTLLVVLISSACVVGPGYHRASAPVPPSYKEAQAQNGQAAGLWRPAAPNDAALRGKWWELYNNAELNSLEQQVNISNQNVIAAEAQYRQARDAVRIERASLFPTITASPSVTVSQSPSGVFTGGSSGFTTGSASGSSGTSATSSPIRTQYTLPVDLSYQADLWGSIRGTVRSDVATAQATFAQLENARLTYQALLAEDYFQLRGVEQQQALLDRTVKSYTEYLQLTQERLHAGVASGADVAQAEAQLDNARTQLIELGQTRAQFEHAIAVLIGKPPAELSVSSSETVPAPPAIPISVPSDLLERRPDIAEAERRMAAQNALIGVAEAAYFPALNISGSGGFTASKIGDLLSWPSRVWSVGPQLAETLFDAGRRRAQVAQAQDAYDFAVANYRQTVLTGLQQVEDALAGLSVLSEASASEADAVRAAQEALDISTYQYRAGTVDYLQVITSQTTALQSELQATSITTQRMVQTVMLIEALGGAWDKLPMPPD